MYGKNFKHFTFFWFKKKKKPKTQKQTFFKQKSYMEI